MTRIKTKTVVLFFMAVFLSKPPVYDVVAISVSPLPPCGVTINTIAIDPGRPDVIYVLTPSGIFGSNVYRSIDSGDNWRAVHKPLSVVGGFFLVVDPKNPQIFYAGWNKSIDGGRTWNNIDYGQGWSSSFAISKLIIHPHNSEILYSLATNGAVYKSINGGASWAAIGDEQLGECKAFAIDPNNSNVVYGQFERRSKDIYRREPIILGGIYKSVDGGATWTSLLPAVGIRELAVDPGNSAIVYAVNNQHGVYRSLNGGKQWNTINHGLPERTNISVFAFDPVNPETIYAGTNHGLFTSTNRDGSWNGWRSIGPESDTRIQTLAINSQNSKIIYVVVSGSRGVFRTTDGGTTWKPVNNGLPALPDCPR